MYLAYWLWIRHDLLNMLRCSGKLCVGIQYTTYFLNFKGMAAKTKKAQSQADSVIKMTQESYDELIKELDHRQNTLRKEIADEIAAARDLGDLSENHAYSVAMEKKELNENRITEIEDILVKAVIATESNSDSLVSIGESVEIENVETKQKRVVTLVGSEETKSANPIEGKISTDSPIGKAIYNSSIGDIVDVVMPMKTMQFKIVKFVKNKK